MADEEKRTGIVFIDDFDRGMVETLGGVVSTDGKMYVVKSVLGVAAPPDFEGIPVFFAFPDDVIDQKILPSFVVRRESLSWAMSRWHLGGWDYKVPAVSAQPVTIRHPITNEVMAQGFTEYELKDQAVPVDILYNVQIRARFRNSLRAEAQKMLRYAMMKFQPYCRVFVKDSEGDTRTYDAFQESASSQDIKPDVAGRETNFNLSVRVEAEIDLNDPVVKKAVSSLPFIRSDLHR